MKKVLFLIAIFKVVSSFGQSFNDEKTSMINYVKRMYNASPFEGARRIEGLDNSYYIAAITLALSPDSKESKNSIAQKKAEQAAKISFAEPCVKFEMLSKTLNENKKTVTYLFSFQPLTDLVKESYKKTPFNGAKIIATTQANYFISVIALDTQKYSSQSIMDKVALLKAKQQANTLFNGSTISSDIILKTDNESTITSSSEIIKEYSMGFVEGLETLSNYISNEKKVFIFYRELSKNK